MAVIALDEGYEGRNLDAVENFHGNTVVYLHWEQHLMFCAALAFPLPPQMPFGAIVGELIPEYYGPHPQCADIDWSTARWELDGKPFEPDFAAPIGEQGIGHKSLLRFWTPGLDGIEGSGS